MIGILHEEGAPLLVGSDTSVRFVIQGFSVHQELANFVAAGLTPYEAIRCATSEPARFLGKSHECGTVTEGKRADLVLVDEDPLADVGALRKISGVFSNGFYLAKSDLDALLARQAQVAASTMPLLQQEPPWIKVEAKAASNAQETTTSTTSLFGENDRSRLQSTHQQFADGS